MPIQVYIILNEREQAKQRIANSLSLALQQDGISSMRPSIEPELFTRLEHSPSSVVVMDYILGDLCTGIDLIAHSKNKLVSGCPKFIFLTDEDSSTAVKAALRIGAMDFISIDDTDAERQTLAAIRNALLILGHTQKSATTIVTAKTRTACHYTFENSPLYKDESSKNLPSIAWAARHRPRQPVIICGPQGSGRKTLANGLLHGNSQAKLPTFNLSAFAEFLSASQPQPDSNTIVIESPEQNLELAAELADKLRRRLDKIRFVFITESNDAANVLSSLLTGLRIDVPGIATRPIDSEVALHRFLEQAYYAIDSAHAPNFSQLNCRNLIAEFRWPGNFAQLKDVTFAAVHYSIEHQIPFEDAFRAMQPLWLCGTMKSKESISPTPVFYGPSAALHAFESCGFNEFRAAIKLQISQQKFNALIRGRTQFDGERK